MSRRSTRRDTDVLIERGAKNCAQLYAPAIGLAKERLKRERTERERRKAERGKR